MSEHRGACSRGVVGRLVVTAAAGVLVTLTCWGVLMLEVPDRGELPVFMLDQGSSVVVR